MLLPVLLALGAVALLRGVVGYNRLVRTAARAAEAWSGIEVQLGRRASLVPGLVETVRGHARHEREALEEVARARAALEAAVGAVAGAGAAAVANEDLTRSVGRLLALVEGYPELQASRSFLDLQEELADVERRIAFAREFYNRVVAAFNARIRSVPDVIVARLCRFGPLEFFGLEEGEEGSVPVELG